MPLWLKVTLIRSFIRPSMEEFLSDARVEESLLHVVKRIAAERPDRPAVSAAGAVWSYQGGKRIMN